MKPFALKGMKMHEMNSKWTLEMLAFIHRDTHKKAVFVHV